MNWDYIIKHCTAYTLLPCGVSERHNDLLYRIGTHVDVLTPDDCKLIEQQGSLSSEQRFRVLDWIVSCQNDVEIKGDLALLIFGREQLEQWLLMSRQAYPNFEFYLSFEHLTKFKSGCEDGICFTMHWMPRPGAPQPDVELDFPWKCYWESGEMFWGEYPGGSTNQFDFNLAVYPNQESFTNSRWLCAEGDRYTTPSEEEANLMSVAQVLKHFLIPA
jgi:hypothetical protein